MSVCSIRPADVQPEFDHAVDDASIDGVDHGVDKVEDKGIRMGHDEEDYGKLRFKSFVQ